MEILFASKNKGKIKEIKNLFSSTRFKIISLFDIPGYKGSVTEDGKSYEENAFKKSIHAANVTKKITISDDSGIEVMVLDKAPGIYSARFGGEEISDKERNLKLLELLQDVPEHRWNARFVCAAAVVDPNKDIKKSFKGVCEGILTKNIRGNKGFGYDPVFYLNKYKKTFAELSPAVKNKISHRAKAFSKLINFLDDIYK